MPNAGYTPMISQYLALKDAHRDALLFFRLGDFYEMFFQDALLASKALDIQLTARDAGGRERVPMCGVPHHSVESYIKRLIDQGYKVAMAEQVEAVTGQKLVKREVVRIITPGTLTDESNQGTVHVAAITASDHYYVVAYLNALTGDLFAEKIWLDGQTLMSQLTVHDVKEVIVPPFFEDRALETMCHAAGIMVTAHHDEMEEPSLSYVYAALPTDLEKKNVKRLLHYLWHTQKRALLYIKPCENISSRDSLYLDGNTIRHLELLKNERQQTEKGSLFALLNLTQTALGSRFLKRQLIRPLKSIAALNDRYTVLETLNTAFLERSQIKDCLASVYDIERIITKASNHTIKPKDFGQLRASLSVMPDLTAILKALNTPRFNALLASWPEVEPLRNLLEKDLETELPYHVSDGFIFKRGVDATLDETRDIVLKGDAFLEGLAAEEREKTGIKKLKIGMNSVFGYYIEVPKSQSAILDAFSEYTRKQTLVNAERFVTPTLKDKEKRILQASDDQLRIEKELFEALIERTTPFIKALQMLANHIAEIDFYSALSDASERYELIRPTLHDVRSIAIEGSFHPVIKALKPEDIFVENAIMMDEQTDILLVTGPNMAGKSTYMRQLALTVIMAQIGAFVPAQKATVPVFDQIFTRIGASDDLVHGQSTFMVEMLEAKRALDNATDQSLLLFDEMGRGTSTYDGLSLAWSLLEYVHEKTRSKMIFSTHYHELTTLDASLERLKNIHVSASKKSGVMQFSHQVKDGPTDDSFGIEVAAMAGLPKAIIKRATQLLKSFEKPPTPHVPTLFDAVEEAIEPSRLEAAFDRVNLDDLSPIDALNLLYEWKKNR